MKFKIGDKVIIVDCYDTCYEDEIGNETYIVKHTVEQDGVWYSLKDGGYQYHEDDLELVAKNWRERMENGCTK